MVNKVILVGNLGKDPEVKHLEGGNMVANITVATSEKYKNRDGEQVEETEWHNCSAWGKLAELMEKYLQKGSKVYLEGKMKTRSYDTEDGQTKYTTEVHVREMKFLSSAPSNEGGIV